MTTDSEFKVLNIVLNISLIFFIAPEESFLKFLAKQKSLAGKD